jgi:organic radical activating enzyme
MAKYEWVETFLSIEGEAKYSGRPTAYVRFTKCNFTCQGFNNPDMKEITNEVLGFDPLEMKDLSDIPEINIGCDSIYAWDNRFKHLWKTGDEHELAEELTNLLPGATWVNPIGGTRAILSLTGGEPTSRAKFIPTLLNAMPDVRHVLVETNCSVPLQQKFITALTEWATACDGLITWSNSPKLSISGEPREKAIQPAIAMMQREMGSNFDQYFKFVCGDTDAEFDEVAEVMELYYAAGIPRDVDVFIMPMCCTEDQQRPIMMAVADKCLERGYIYCHRIHNTVYENAIGK